ncbi:unnamed protein product [Notodromas monacha]|uniref:Endosome-associated-trafficking regulator 1 n=1 Tax=Notodromas monacha TaxID=399045 RepID=A0A7R9BTB0_9CRUS|nr:unnamed protein product [Notodromas monacha]CAG0920299.1 unnamed protein product [Notodromas monacha]
MTDRVPLKDDSDEPPGERADDSGHQDRGDEKRGAKKTRDKSSKGSKEDNPLSFRQFLATGDNRSTGARPKSRPMAAPQQQQMPPSYPAQNGDSGHFVDSGLPDFLRDYMSPPGFEETAPQYVHPVDLTSDSRDAAATAADHHHHHHKREESVRDEDGGQNFASLSLPDFLSDGVLASAEAGAGSAAVAEPRRNEAEVQMLEVQSSEALRSELLHCRSLLDRERERTRMLEQKLERLRTGEYEESLRRAEIKLSETNSRAERAEKALADSELARRKLEKKLAAANEGGVGSSSNSSGVGSSCDYPQNLVLMRVRRAAAQLSLASEIAETSLGQLLSGVESLKTVADELRALNPDSDESSLGACGEKKS